MSSEIETEFHAITSDAVEISSMRGRQTSDPTDRAPTWIKHDDHFGFIYNGELLCRVSTPGLKPKTILVKHRLTVSK